MWVSGWDWWDQSDENNWSVQVGGGRGTQELLFKESQIAVKEQKRKVEDKFLESSRKV